jgi:hypothetical protein
VNDSTSFRLENLSKLASNRSARTPWPLDVIAEVRALRGLGISVSKIAAETGISQPLLYRWLSKPVKDSKRQKVNNHDFETDEVKVIEVMPSSISFHFRWRNLEIRFQ